MANPQFEAIRRKIQGGSQIQAQESEDKIKRAFARQGGVGSGEFVKQLQMSRESDLGRREEALKDVDLAEQEQLRGEQRQDELMQKQFGFQSSEAEKQRGFAGTEAEKARAAQESQFGRQLSSQQEQFGKTFGLQEKSTMAQIDQADRQFQQDQRDQFFNRLKSTLETKDRATREHLLNFEQAVFGDLEGVGIRGYGGGGSGTQASISGPAKRSNQPPPGYVDYGSPHDPYSRNWRG